MTPPAKPPSDALEPPRDPLAIEGAQDLRWPSALLLRGRQMVQIEHKGAVYQLRLTRQDKLILTK